MPTLSCIPSRYPSYSTGSSHVANSGVTASSRHSPSRKFRIQNPGRSAGGYVRVTHPRLIWSQWMQTSRGEALSPAPQQRVEAFGTWGRE
jgi:hypothetical protein